MRNRETEFSGKAQLRSRRLETRYAIWSMYEVGFDGQLGIVGIRKYDVIEFSIFVCDV